MWCALAAGPEPADLLREVWHRVSADDHLPYVRLHFELQAAAGRRPDLYGRFLDDLVGSWIELIAALLVRRGVAGELARTLATYVYASFRGLQLDLLATGDRSRVDAAFAELARSIAARVKDAGDSPGAAPSRPDR